MRILIILVTLVIFIGITWFLGNILEWAMNSPINATKIEFKSFEQFYLINPSRWELDAADVTCIISEEMQLVCGHLTTHTEKRIFYFGFLDYLKYKRFRKKINKNERKQAEMNATADMLKVVKEDIANMEALAQQQQKQAVDNISSILDRLQ